MVKTQQIKSNQVINGFRLIQNTEDLVVLEVAVCSPLEVALHPYLSTDWKYVSVSKGVNNTLTIIDKDGKSKMYQINRFSSKDRIKALPVQISKLRKKVLETIFKYGILIEVPSLELPEKLQIKQTSFGGAYTVEGTCNVIVADKNTSFEKVIKKVESYLGIHVTETNKDSDITNGYSWTVCYESVEDFKKSLNRLETFPESFQIYRDGKTITLARDELYDFHRLDGAVGGMLTLDSYKSIANPEDIPIIEELCKDEEVCFSLDMDVQDKIFMAHNIGEIEAGVCEKYIDRYRKEHDLPVKSSAKHLD